MIATLSRLIHSLFYRPDLLQVAALCWRETDNGLEILLIRSLDSNRWIIPKGWPMRGKTLSQAAEIEAWEEAGVSGQISADPIGSFQYEKRRGSGVKQSCTVQVFALHVTTRKDDFPEADLRRAKWFSQADARKRLREPDLQALIQNHFTP
ncbi:NUDIX hydrolase [Pseudorhodobacter ferrugineus]|uniref:NUDIX hydrolase n=1 Tax=Pseudorhodobacter ferrugineus TaxID=77008 RepID=UPI0003B3F9D8|nr:NUDIX hydrolase [Pseudorhodobacter ferrugineus]